LLTFGSLETEINKSKSVALAVQSNYNVQTQESINILKIKQNETTITISQVAMQIHTNKTEVNNRENIIVRFGQKRTVRITFWNLTQI
jgi:hypothetical protein